MVEVNIVSKEHLVVTRTNAPKGCECPICEFLKQTYVPAFVRSAESCMEDMDEADYEDPEIVWEMATDADRAVTLGYLTKEQYHTFINLNDADKLMLQAEFYKHFGFGG